MGPGFFVSASVGDKLHRNRPQAPHSTNTKLRPLARYAAVDEIPFLGSQALTHGVVTGSELRTRYRAAHTRRHRVISWPFRLHHPPAPPSSRAHRRASAPTSRANWPTAATGRTGIRERFPEVSVEAVARGGARRRRRARRRQRNGDPRAAEPNHHPPVSVHAATAAAAAIEESASRPAQGPVSELTPASAASSPPPGARARCTACRSCGTSRRR